MGLLEKAARWIGLTQAPDPSATSGPDRNELLTELAEPEGDRLEDYARAERYYEGDHKVRLNDRERQYLQRSGIPFAENFCETIIDTFSNRMTVTGFLCDDNAEATEWADGFFAGDAIAEVAGTVHTQTPMKGDAFLGVDWSPELNRPVFSWNDPAIATPVYDAFGRLIMVAKSWSEWSVSPTNPDGKHIRRLNLHLPDRIEKWFTWSGSGQAEWMMHMDAGDEVWPTPWVRPDGTPRGVSVLHFRHKPKGRIFGRSRLRSAIPQQDFLNKQLIDLANILDNQGWDQRWATGVSSKTAGTLKNVAGEVWATPNENAKFGQFDSAEVKGVLEAIEGCLRRMAGRSSTPMHLMIAGAITQLPSGESLKTAEAPLIFECKDAHPTYGGNWSAAMAIAAGLEADFGSSGLVYAAQAFDTQWEDPTSRNELAELQVSEAKMTIGVSRTTLLEEAGYDPEKEAERRRDEALEAQANFNAGLGAGDGTGGGPDDGGDGGDNGDEGEGNGDGS